MEAVSKSIIEQNREYPYQRFGFALILHPLLEEPVGDVKTSLWVLMGAVGFVLLLVCANVAGLLLCAAPPDKRRLPSAWRWAREFAGLLGNCSRKVCFFP